MKTGKIKALLILFMLAALNLKAADDVPLPCDNSDPDLECPIDTWVLLLAVIVLMFTFIRLARRHNQASP
ncbi:hypothetical protein GCM10023149_26510 [Mucilaginibacter gynuensis]|uniref:Uncharacterized protein n=1 Tax=Mucilaginibacter gynuensis TaxID=1302236 RepID=A0ABP8GI10_9SPHI